RQDRQSRPCQRNDAEGRGGAARLFFRRGVRPAGAPRGGGAGRVAPETFRPTGATFARHKRWSARTLAPAARRHWPSPGLFLYQRTVQQPPANRGPELSTRQQAEGPGEVPEPLPLAPVVGLSTSAAGLGLPVLRRSAIAAFEFKS